MTCMKKWVTLLLVLLCGCGLREQSVLQPAPKFHTLPVFAASSLTEAFSELGEQFEASHAGVDVIFNFAGSQTLRIQILEGTQTDVFASADQTEMEALVAAGLVEAGTPEVFATNMLAIILPENNPTGIESIEQLSQAGIKVVIAAQQVPAGQYTRAALR